MKYPLITKMDEHAADFETIRRTLSYIQHAGFQVHQRVPGPIHDEMILRQADWRSLCDEIIRSFGIPPLKLRQEIAEYLRVEGEGLERDWLHLVDRLEIIDYFDRAPKTSAAEQAAAAAADVKEIMLAWGHTHLPLEEGVISNKWPVSDEALRNHPEPELTMKITRPRPSPGPEPRVDYTIRADGTLVEGRDD